MRGALLSMLVVVVAAAQQVVDVRPGRITYADGVLYADEQAKAGANGLPSEWSSPRTGLDSRAEFFLGACVVAHLDAGSSVRLLPDGLELLSGTAVVHADTATTVVVRGISTVLGASGVYRFRARRIFTLWAESGLREQEFRERWRATAQRPPNSDPYGRNPPGGLPDTWTTPQRPPICLTAARW